MSRALAIAALIGAGFMGWQGYHVAQRAIAPPRAPVTDCDPYAERACTVCDSDPDYCRRLVANNVLSRPSAEQCTTDYDCCRKAGDCDEELALDPDFYTKLDAADAAR